MGINITKKYIRKEKRNTSLSNCQRKIDTIIIELFRYTFFEKKSCFNNLLTII